MGGRCALPRLWNTQGVELTDLLIGSAPLNPPPSHFPVAAAAPTQSTIEECQIYSGCGNVCCVDKLCA
jgi:hypothetical protein